MKRIKEVLSFLGSKTLTVWIVGLFIVYYLTIAVWSKEAFAAYIQHLSGNNLFRAFYILFFLNILLRVFAALKGLWTDRARFFLRLPLYAGLVIFLLSFFMSVNIRETKWMIAGEGDILDIPWDRTSLLRVVRVESAIRKKALRTETSAIFDYEPALVLMDRDGNLHTIGAFPAKKVKSTYIHILKFGIGPGVELKRNNDVLFRGYMALRLTPFGTVDTFEMEPYPYKFYVSILPSRVIKKGKETARHYDLEKPLYRVEVVKGDKMITMGETDHAISFDGNMSLGFFPPADWVLLDMARDPFLVPFVAGVVLLLVGAVIYPFSLFASCSSMSGPARPDVPL